MPETYSLPAVRAATGTDLALPREAPHNLDAEKALLGAILVNNNIFDKVGDFLRPDHFYDPVHGRIFEAMATLISRGQIADTKTLHGLFEQDPALAPVGGARYLVELAAGVITVINAVDYAQLIHDLYLRRQLIDLGEDTVNEAYRHDLDEPASRQIEKAEQRLFELAQTGEVDRGFVKLGQSLQGSLKMAEEAFKSDTHVTGVTTGLRDMDRKLGGFQRSDLVIVAGRPSMGKTALATNMAFNAANAYIETNGKQGSAVAFFSLEMSSEQLATRLLGEHSRVPSDKIRRGEIKADDFAKFYEASKILSRTPLFIDDTPGLTVASLRTRARRLKRLQPNLGLIVIDYLQLLRGSSAKAADNRVQEVSEITRGLKALAKELDLPVIALSQLSRAVEARDDKRPQLADLRESGSIEQDADVVIFVYREEYYHSRAEPMQRQDENEDKFNQRYTRWQERGDQIRNIAEVIVAKQRHGPIGTVELHFDGQFTKFSDLETKFSDNRDE
jgi:replicative DNA helicase